MSTAATHVSVPSAARTITLDAFVPVPRGVSPTQPATPSWPLKDPADILDYQFDIAPALIGNDGDAISTLDVTITPANTGDLTVVSIAADGKRAVLWLSGGISGTAYTIAITVGTVAGRTIARSILLPVTSLTTSQPTATVLLTSSGTPLVDQNGNPIQATP